MQNPTIQKLVKYTLQGIAGLVTFLQVISDYHLLAMLALFISIDLLIIVIREVIDPQKVTQRFTGNEVSRKRASQSY